MDSTFVQQLTSLGVGGMFVVLVLRLVFDFIKARNGRKNGNPGPSEHLAEITVHLQHISDKLGSIDQNLDDYIKESGATWARVLTVLEWCQGGRR